MQRSDSADEIREEMRIAPDKANRFENVMARCEVYTNDERADCHGVIIPKGWGKND